MLLEIGAIVAIGFVAQRTIRRVRRAVRHRALVARGYVLVDVPSSLDVMIIESARHMDLDSSSVPMWLRAAAIAQAGAARDQGLANYFAVYDDAANRHASCEISGQAYQELCERAKAVYRRAGDRLQAELVRAGDSELRARVVREMYYDYRLPSPGVELFAQELDTLRASAARYAVEAGFASGERPMRDVTPPRPQLH